MADGYAKDVARISLISVVPTILDTVCRLTGMGFATIARVSEDRWVACSIRDDIDFGLEPGGELELETTICHEVRQSGLPVIISDVASDPVFCDHRTPALYGFRSYISMPIMLPDGQFFGTLCAIDPQPRDLEKPEICDVFRMFADLIGFHLAAADRMTAAEASLADEREIAEVREQFIAVLGHDLRNPLASVGAGVNLMRRAPDPSQTSFILDQMQSSIDRMVSLIDNILDLARGRLGGGLALQTEPVDFERLLRQSVAELAAAYPERDIRLHCTADRPVRCDAGRMSQLLSNIVGNAVTHGDADRPVEVDCSTSETHLVVIVTNSGDEIPAAARDKLFQPFHRGEIDAHREGLGLGLYIASQIAIAHEGELTVDSSPAETRFTFRMPLQPHLA